MEVAFDLETTGVDPFNDVPVSYAFVSRNDCIYELVNPGIPIPESATEIHGITTEQVAHAKGLAPSIIDIANLLHMYWTRGDTIVGMNVSYDLTMTHNLLHKLTDCPLTIAGDVLDVLVLDRHYDKWRKGSRTLSALCETYGVELLDAHSAQADALACLDVLDAMRKKYPMVFLTLESVTMNLQRIWFAEWLKSYSEYSGTKFSEGRYMWPVMREE